MRVGRSSGGRIKKKKGNWLARYPFFSNEFVCNNGEFKMQNTDKIIEYLDLNRKMIISTYNGITQSANINNGVERYFSEQELAKIAEILLQSTSFLEATTSFFFNDL